jgi:GTP-binding protein LepA
VLSFEQMATDRIRNFSIVAHIDHGKSTLADRLLSLTGTMDAKKAVGQVLDSMDLEKERGITIKAHTVRLLYTAKDGKAYTLNLIDTPGHVDFSYEVSRSLAACEGALLIVDAAQGVEAQTLANYYLALDGGLEIVPVINKIDLPAADVEGTRTQITELLELDGDAAIAISAKHGTGVEDVLEAIVQRIPAPTGDPGAPLKALVFDSFYDSYQGVVVYIRLIDGRVRAGQRVLFMSNGKFYEVQQVGVFSPDMRPVDELAAGQVGYLTASIKRVADAKIGETITDALRPTAEPCPGYRDAKPMVFAGLYPIEDTDYEGLRDALEKLRLNDSAFNYEPETSLALGYGFRCGFLGMLHLEIVQERLEREFNLSLIVTAPSVRYRVMTTEGEMLEVENPSKLPPPDKIEHMEEPYVRGSIFVPTEFMSEIYKLAQEKRGEHRSLEYVGKRVHILFDFPLAEIVVDFYDKLKSVSKGYASFDYDFLDFRESELVKLDILLNGDPVDALSVIVHRDKAYERGKALTEKLRGVIPRQLYEVAIQAAIGSRVIARETVKAMGKNVTAKCYGGDITRKRKLLEKQKEGKKRMKQVGKVEVPQEAFLSVLKS